MPRERPTPKDFEPEWLHRSLDRYYTAGLVFMVLLLAGFVFYLVREPALRADAQLEQQTTYMRLGAQLFSGNCAQCHGKNGTGGSAPVLNSRQFLKATSDNQIHALIAGGVTGTEMPSWSIDYGGTLTDEQVRQIVVYLRSLESNAPDVPDWRRGSTASATQTATSSTVAQHP